MARVLVEQTFDPPMADEAYDTLARKLDVCLEIRDAMWVRQYVAAARDRRVLEIEARDAASVRRAVHSAGVPLDRALAVELLEPELVAPAAVHAVVEVRGEAQLDPSFPGASWIRTYQTNDRQWRLTEVAGPDEATVLAACRLAGDRSWIAGRVIRIEDDPVRLARRDRLRARLRR